MSERNIRVAIAQASPVLLDLEGSTAKAVRLVGEAARAGAAVVAFGESWLPGYPAWLDLCPGAAYWDHPPAKRAYARLVENSAVIPGPVTDRLCAAARENGIVVVIGVHERLEKGPGHGTLYNTNLVIDADGVLKSRHSKLVPTHAERLVWGMGNGSGLEAVPTAAGRVGSLICWEHWMPLARQAMHESAEEIHVAAWPTVRDMYLVASRHYAFEGRCFVLAAGLLTSARDLPAELDLPPELRDKRDTLVCSGGSTIIGPDGAIVAGPVFDREELVVADIDLRRIREESMSLDVTGHFNRPDVFRFSKRVVGPVAAAGDAPPAEHESRAGRSRATGEGKRWRGRRGSNPRPPA